VRPSSPLLLLVSCTGCAPPGSAVSAPLSPPAAAVRGSATAGSDLPIACDKPWLLDVMGGEGRVVVVCAHEVRRQALDPQGAVARSLSPALDPTRERVCGCVERLRAPAFVDLVFTAKPEEGRVTVQASSEDDLDPELGPPFVACVGAVVARFAPSISDECTVPGKTLFVYPVRVDLAP
jgi:hypothetical protein